MTVEADIRVDRRGKLRERITLERLERLSWLRCGIPDCQGGTAWIVDDRGVQRALCPDHGAEAFSRGRRLIPVDVFLPAER